MRNNESAYPPKADPIEPDLLTVSKQARSQEYEEFLKYVAQSTGTISYQQLLILYPAICQAAMEFLLVQKKSVDLGFVIVHPRPHRANWKQIMVALFPGVGPSLLGKSKVMKESILTSTGFLTKLLSGELLAIGSSRYVVWGLDLELRKSWWVAMFRHEKARLSRLGSVNYAAATAREIIKLRPKLIHGYLSFLRQVSYPCAKIVQSRIYKRGFIMPFIPKGRVRAVATEDIPVHPVVARAPEELATPTLASLVQANASLPEVHHVQPENTDLRVTIGPDATEQ